MTDYFPAKLAHGPRFCNRHAERTLLKQYIHDGRHTVLVSPRRYGKSSLVHQVVSELSFPCASIDLFLAHDDKATVKRLLKGVSDAVSQILPPNSKFLDTVQGLFRQFRVSISARCFNIEASFDAIAFDATDQLFNALQALDDLAKRKKKHVIFFIDEFQDITSAESAKSLQGAIRHIAQKTSNLVFIFSGSNRHLLLELFDDKSMPIYMLCDKLHLQRMASADYLPHIQKAAKSKWKKSISLEAFYTIMALSELHPFYVNMLCHELWLADKPPTPHQVQKAWHACYEKEHRRLVAEIEKLSSKQQILLQTLAIFPTKEPTGQQFILRTGCAVSSIRQSLKVLLEKDMLYVAESEDKHVPHIRLGHIHVLDPLLAYALRLYA